MVFTTPHILRRNGSRWLAMLRTGFTPSLGKGLTSFAGNPVLFVGLGMNEGDFLASLERFVSDDRPGHIAPSFAIWNAKPIADGKPRKSNEVTPDDELLRLRLYQRFGTYLIFDVELKKFEVDPNPPPKGFDLAKLGRGVRYLAEHAADYATPFQWERGDFRSMQDYLPNPSDPMDSLWRSGSRVWPVASTPAPRFDPGFAPSIISPSIVRATGTTSLSDDDYLAYLLRDGSPVKLFLDKPGTGHGYLASVIRKTVTRELGPTKGAFPSDPFIYFQINAGFAWEIDTTFGLVSGLSDSKTAYATEQSRTAAISKFVSDFEHALRSSTLMPRRMIIAINGIDRFFDANGYARRCRHCDPTTRHHRC